MEKVLTKFSLDTKIKLGMVMGFGVIDAILFPWLNPRLEFADKNVLGHIGLVFVAMILFVAILYLYEGEEGEGYLFRSGVMFALASAPVAAFCYLAPATPFSSIDHWLYVSDRFLGYDAPTFLHWVRSHPWLNELSDFIYATMIYQLYMVVFALSMLGERRAMEEFFFAFFVSLYLGCIFYFFLPSTDLVAAYKSTRFTWEQKQVFYQFYQLHHHEHVFRHVLGIISFPSFHTIWAILMAYYSRSRKLLFYPFLILDTLLIISTLSTGWHYLTDVIGGFLFAFSTIWFTTWFYKQVIVLQNYRPVWEIQGKRRPVWTATFQLLCIVAILSCTYLDSIIPMLMLGLPIVYHFILWREPQPRLATRATSLKGYFNS